MVYSSGVDIEEGFPATSWSSYNYQWIIMNLSSERTFPHLLEGWETPSSSKRLPTEKGLFAPQTLLGSLPTPRFSEFSVDLLWIFCGSFWHFPWDFLGSWPKINDLSGFHVINGLRSMAFRRDASNSKDSAYWYSYEKHTHIQYYIYIYIIIYIYIYVLHIHIHIHIHIHVNIHIHIHIHINI